MAERAPITERLLAGERPALARLISWAEDADERFPAALARLYSRVGRSWRTGVTGPPGAGKSTLVNVLTGVLRERGRTVGILAVDPTSPFTGGALLGDRIRMEERTADPGVFIRSMASRGARGGLARAAVDALDVMDAFGFDELLVETVGVGQAEYDVMGAADTVVVVCCPGAGDSVQAMKAGLLEVADVLVVNKADRPDAEKLRCELEDALRFRGFDRAGWEVPVVPCSAGRGEGVGEVLAAIDRHRAHLEVAGLEAGRRSKRIEQIRRVVGERLSEAVWGPGGPGDRMEAALRDGATPYDVAASIVDSILAPGRDGGGCRNGSREGRVPDR